MGRSNRPRPKRLGEKLRQVRADLNLTLEQMIERLDYKDSPVYPTNISAMERGEREPPLLLLLAYAHLAGVSTDLLIDDKLDLPNRIPSSPKLRGINKNLSAKKSSR
jgi:transcriptional regulator with XRE-family HTH domain